MHKYTTDKKPAQGWRDLADSRLRTSPPQGWDSCYSLLMTGHKMFRNWYQTKSVKGVGPVDMDEVGHPLGLKVLGNHRPGGDHLVHLQRSFCRFWGRNMFFPFLFFHLELVPFLLHKEHCIGVWVDRLGAEIFVFRFELIFTKKTLSVPLFLMSQIQTPLQHTVRRTWSLSKGI